MSGFHTSHLKLTHLQALQSLNILILFLTIVFVHDQPMVWKGIKPKVLHVGVQSLSVVNHGLWLYVIFELSCFLYLVQ